MQSRVDVELIDICLVEMVLRIFLLLQGRKDFKKFRFLANPCDGIFFGETEIVFMEFKTGNAKLSDSQKRIRDIVKSGKVRFETFRVDDKGTHLKIESSMTDTL